MYIKFLHVYSWLDSTFFCLVVSVHLFIHLLKDILVASQFWQLRIKLPWTSVSKSNVHLDRYQGSWFQDWMVIACLFICLFIYLAAPGLSYGTRDLPSSLWYAGSLVMVFELFSYSMWDLVPWPGIKPGPRLLETWSLSHWTTREVLVDSMFRFIRNCRLF